VPDLGISTSGQAPSKSCAAAPGSPAAVPLTAIVLLLLVAAGLRRKI
jgi:MYXO-CTERM domain-containing protein